MSKACETFGIDLSKWQKGFDFAKAKKEGVKFAIIKGSQKDFKDGEFERHYKNAREKGILTGAYHYLTAVTPEEAKREAKFMIDACLEGKQFEYPIFADAEDALLKALPKTAVDEIIKTFCGTLEAAGYWAGFYCNYDFYRNNCSGESLSKRYSLWLASWTHMPPAECQMWQFGGETNLLRKNKVAGVTCDQNYSFRDFPALIKEKGLNGTANGQNPSGVTSGVASGVPSGSTPNKSDSSPSAPPAPLPEKTEKDLKVGDAVRLKAGAKIYGTDKSFASWVYGAKLWVREINGDRVVISTQKTGAVTGAVSADSLTAQ